MNWYCLHTKPQRESQVESYCRHTLGVETYYPQLRVYRTIRRVRRLVVGPLFPRYFFCRFEPAHSFRAVRYAPESLGIVNVGGEPAIVADSLIAELRQWAGNTLDQCAVRPSLCSGDAVEITEGPLRGFSAVILRADDDRDRVAILLSLLNSGATTTIRRDWLAPGRESQRTSGGQLEADRCLSFSQ
jgi:transcriptional antiterminator RfaH